ncbi:hypothetical protein LTR86_005877 [Recurvomyces mirabilis]|nr:hypothetical protein LTR86_005877 [Recurvomyces mirabilis]
MESAIPSTLQTLEACKPPTIKLCPVFNAPREVRNIVYELCFKSVEMVVIKHNSSTANSVPLLQTCRQIRSEATELMVHRTPFHDTMVKIALGDLDFSNIVAYLDVLHENELEQLAKKSVMQYSCTLSDAEVPDLTNNLLAWLHFRSAKHLSINSCELGILHPQVYWFIGVTRRLPNPWLEEVEIAAEAIRPTSSLEGLPVCPSRPNENRIHGLEQNVRRRQSEERRAEQKFKYACGVLYASIGRRSVAMHAVVRDEDLERKVDQEQRIANKLERVHTQRKEEIADARNVVQTAREQTMDE